MAPEFRGLGIAGAILNSIVTSACAMAGVEQVHLWVLEPETSAAKRLYDKAGFVSQGPVVKCDLKIDGSYVDAECMVLTLA